MYFELWLLCSFYYLGKHCCFSCWHYSRLLNGQEIWLSKTLAITQFIYTYFKIFVTDYINCFLYGPLVLSRFKPILPLKWGPFLQNIFQPILQSHSFISHQHLTSNCFEVQQNQTGGLPLSYL